MKKFIDRSDAGQQLATLLQSHKNNPNVIILALPRGGVPVAYEIATALCVPLDVFIVRKLGAPEHNELAIGAIATGGVIVLNEAIFQDMKITKTDLDAVIQSEKNELARRENAYRNDRPSPNLKGKIVILVDDGIATGATIRAALMALEQHYPLKVIIAVPVAPLSSYEEIEPLSDELICLLKPEDFYAVGAYYNNFIQITDEEVSTLLCQSQKKNGEFSDT